MVIICSDHRGYQLKIKLKEIFKKLNIEIKDLNPDFVENDDYPQITKIACKEVLKSENNFGVFICGTGTGMNIVANKVKGIRATESECVEKVVLSRKKNNCNVLCVGADFVSDMKIKKMVLAFLKTEFSKEERHVNRINNMES